LDQHTSASETNGTEGETEQFGNQETNELIFLDLTNMFGRIPKEELCTLLRNNCYHGHPDDTKYASIVKKIISQKYGQFKN
jgi:hypothetical protein